MSDDTDDATERNVPTASDERLHPNLVRLARDMAQSLDYSRLLYINTHDMPPQDVIGAVGDLGFATWPAYKRLEETALVSAGGVFSQVAERYGQALGEFWEKWADPAYEWAAEQEAAAAAGADPATDDDAEAAEGAVAVLVRAEWPLAEEFAQDLDTLQVELVRTLDGLGRVARIPDIVALADAKRDRLGMAPDAAVSDVDYGGAATVASLDERRAAFANTRAYTGPATEQGEAKQGEAEQPAPRVDSFSHLVMAYRRNGGGDEALPVM